MYLITGDVHNRFGELNSLINRKKPEAVICCGDFGYWPKFNNHPRNPTESFSDIKLQSAKWIRWIDGNHEDFWSLKERKSDEIEPGIIYMPRGSILTLLDGRTILFMGGARSVDQKYRKLGIDWFPEEEIKHSDLENLPDIHVDIFITHTCPVELVKPLARKYMMMGGMLKDEEASNYALTSLWERYKPDLWFFGHWHQYGEYKVGNTQCYALSAPGFPGRWYMWLPSKK